MKKNLIILFLLIAVLITGCNAQNKETVGEVKETEKQEDETTREIRIIGVDEFKKSKDDDWQIIDVRKTYQYNGWDTENGHGGHIEGALVFPEDWLPTGNVNPYDTARLNLELSRIAVDKNKKTLLYDDETLSDETSNKYKELGFTNLYVLDGGMNAYVEAELPVEAMENYSVLVHPKWVQDLVDGKNPKTFKGEKFRVIEFGGKIDDFEKGHIKDAVYVDSSILEVPGPGTVPEYDAIPMEIKKDFWNRPSDEVIKAKLEEIGVTKDTTTVVYAAKKDATWGAARFAVMLLYSGVEDVRFLDGGKTYCASEGVTMVEGKIQYPSIDDFGEIARTDAIIDYEEELKLVDNQNAVLASIRCWEEYISKESGYSFIGEAGDIANSRFGYAGTSMADYRNPDNTMFSYPHMVARWERWGIVPEKEVSFHCGTGYRASETYLYALALGWPNIHMYDGGWYEWHLHKDAPRLNKGLPDDAPEQAPDFTAGIPMKN